MSKAIFVKWSYSSVNTLRECNRKYYFSNILATHGRRVPLRRKAYELKKMQNFAMWRGSVVDKFIEKVIIPAIIAKKDLDFELLADLAVDLAKRQFDYSKYKCYKDPESKMAEVGDEFCILDIHELGRPYQQEDLEHVYASIRQTVLGIAELKMPDGKGLIAFLKECNLLLPNVINWGVNIEKSRVAPQIDLIAYHNWKPVIIDWKLSDSYTSDYSRQLVICGLTVYLKRLESGKPAYQYEDIKIFEANLLKGVVKEHEFSVEKVNELTDYINLTGKDIWLLTRGADEDEIEIDNFEYTDNEGHCQFCNYQSLCSFLYQNNSYDEKSYNEFVQSGKPA